MCKKKSLPTDGVKYQLVKRLADGQCTTAEYLAFDSIPRTITELRKLTIFQLKSTLNEIGICSLGNKDDLILRVFLVKSNRENAICFQERQDILKTIEVAEEIIKRQYTKRVVQVQRVRKHPTSRFQVDNVFEIPDNINSFKDIPNIFADLKEFLKTSKKCVPEEPIELIARVRSLESSYESFFEIGTVIKLKITDRGFSLGCGWFSATIQDSETEMDEVTVTFLDKMDEIMTIEVAPLYGKGNIKLLQ